MASVWDEIEQKLVELYSLPHNRMRLPAGATAAIEAKRKVAEIRSGMSTVSPEDYTGPKLFLRVVGSANRAYSGEWWFDASILDDLEKAYSRVYFSASDKKRALRDMLRELLAVSTEWNTFSEVWALALPSGERLRGYGGPGTAQKLFANLPLSDKANRLLVGKAHQIYFPVKNPLWVQQYQSLA